MTVEPSEPVNPENGTVYRFYVNATDDTDKISAVFGNDQMPLVFSTPDGIYNDVLNSSWSAESINPAFFDFWPDLQDDSYGTIGLNVAASLSGIPGAQDPSRTIDSALAFGIYEYFTLGGTELNVNTFSGEAWYVLNTAGNAFPTDGRWLIAQITTTGSISGQINVQIFPLGVGANEVKKTFVFDGCGTFY